MLAGSMQPIAGQGAARCPLAPPSARRAAPQPRPACRARAAKPEQGEDGLTGEWPVNWSLASYEDVGEYFKTNLFKDSADPGTTLEALMSKGVTCATPDQDVSVLKGLFEKVTGVPVVKSLTDRTLVGVVSKKDLGKPGKTVSEIMSTPPIAARASNKVADAACLMLKHKVHRIPIVDNQAAVIGMVTRTDIFTALEEQAEQAVAGKA